MKREIGDTELQDLHNGSQDNGAKENIPHGPWPGIFEKLFNFCSIAFFAVIFCGCTVGNIHNNSNVANISSAEQARTEIRVGMTMDEVRAKWGKPSSQHTSNDTVYWGYSHRKARIYGIPGLAKVDEKAVNIVFEKGRVSNVLFQENSNY